MTPTDARRRRRLFPVIVLVAALTGTGCTGSGADGNRSGGPSSPAAPVGLMSLDVFTAAGIRATRVLPHPGDNRRLDVRDDMPVLAAGDALLSVATNRSFRQQQLVRSTDFGKSWQNVALPGAPTIDASLTLTDVRGMVAAGETVHDQNYLWMSDDGAGWRGGLLPAPGGNVARPAQLPDGRLVVDALSSPGHDVFLASADRGKTWRPIACPPLWRVVGPSPDCVMSQFGGANLWVRRAEVSLDAGRTWRKTSVVPDPGSKILPMVASSVPLPAGGWIGAVNVILDDTGPFVAYLARSTDAVRWEPIVPNPCDRNQHGGAEVSRPRALGDRWLIAYTCTDKNGFPQRSQLYLLDRDASRAKLLTTVDRPGASFGPPVAVGDTVVVPEIQAHGDVGGTVSFLRLRV